MNELSKYSSWPQEQTSLRAVGECLAIIKELHPEWKYDKDLTVKLWHDALKKFPVNLVKRASLNVAQKNRFIPKLADVLAEIKTLETDQLKIAEQEPFDWFASLSETEREEVIEKSQRYQRGEEVEFASEFEERRLKLIKKLYLKFQDEKEREENGSEK